MLNFPWKAPVQGYLWFSSQQHPFHLHTSQNDFHYKVQHPHHIHPESSDTIGRTSLSPMYPEDTLNFPFYCAVVFKQNSASTVRFGEAWTHSQNCISGWTWDVTKHTSLPTLRTYVICPWCASFLSFKVRARWDNECWGLRITLDTNRADVTCTKCESFYIHPNPICLMPFHPTPGQALQYILCVPLTLSQSGRVKVSTTCHQKFHIGNRLHLFLEGIWCNYG